MPPDFLEHLGPLLAGEEESFVRSCGLPLPEVLRINRLRGSLEDLHAVLAERGADHAPAPFAPEALVVPAAEPGRWLEHALGLFYVQEAVSMLPVQALALSLCGRRIRRALDLCAAPGSKTTQLAALMGDEGILLANEPRIDRLMILAANVLRAGASRTVLAAEDGCRVTDALPGRFDAVLLDAPCSGEGTVRKDPRALADWSVDRLQRLARVQRDLLAGAMRATAPGGSLIYSTCALSPEENERVLEEGLGRAGADFEVLDLGSLFPGAERCRTAEGYLRILPHQFDTGGFFVAALRRAGELPDDPLDDDRSGSGEDESLGAEARDFATLIEDRYGCGRDRDPFRLRSMPNGDLWALPRGVAALEARLRLNRPGFRLAERKKQGLVPHHDLALHWGSRFRRGYLEIPRAAACRFAIGLDLPLPAEALPDEEILLRHRGLPLGFARPRRGRLENLIPRAFCRPSLI